MINVGFALRRKCNKTQRCSVTNLLTKIHDKSKFNSKLKQHYDDFCKNFRIFNF